MRTMVQKKRPPEGGRLSKESFSGRRRRTTLGGLQILRAEGSAVCRQPRKRASTERYSVKRSDFRRIPGKRSLEVERSPYVDASGKSSRIRVTSTRLSPSMRYSESSKRIGPTGPAMRPSSTQKVAKRV